MKKKNPKLIFCFDGQARRQSLDPLNPESFCCKRYDCTTTIMMKLCNSELMLVSYHYESVFSVENFSDKKGDVKEKILTYFYL